MTDRPASWRMPTPKQMEKLANAAAVRGNGPPARTPGPGDKVPPEYWQSILDDVATDRRPAGPSIRTQRLIAAIAPSIDSLVDKRANR